MTRCALRPMNFSVRNLMPQREASGDSVATAIRIGLARTNKTQTALARHLKLSQPSIHRRMAGKVPWRIHELTAAAEFLGITVPDLLNEKASA
ncbi:transcriptional repressor [Mycobacterium phage Rebel]|uniref:Helix-turn-helix DNA binding domain protein n=1 Tax=Mycobacterium phage Rebel TaxID=2743932 RepID=A0AA48ZM64_9CAUD|nr:transcriptional repressor [Mycobacterium phage Rebel]QKY78945.1 helix-turn-helix DNA binding domain protein [Mycobacterium phage Rebel]